MSVKTRGFSFVYNYSQKTYHKDAACVWIIDNQLGRRNLSLYAQGELRIARGKFSQLKEQARKNLAIAGQSAKPFHNCEKVSEVQKVNTTQILADELKTSANTASRIIQIQAKENSGARTDLYQNSDKGLTPVNSTQTLADELKTSYDTSSRIIQIQAKAKNATADSAVAESFVSVS